MAPPWSPVLFIFVTFCVLGVQSRFVKFSRGYEYQYTFQSDAEIHDVGKFKIQAKISFTNIQETLSGQELLLRVYNFHFSPANDHTVTGHDLDLSKWFSFVITHHGEILRVYHPPEEDETLAIKKGIAALIAGKLHDQHEVNSINSDGGWSYEVQEYGHEGHHNATYTVLKTAEGQVFKKVRHGHPVPNARCNYLKTMHFNDELGTIHSVLVEEDFTSPTSPPGFDPHYGMRNVKAVNEFSTMAYPELSAISKGDMKFLTRYTATDVLSRVDAGMLVSSIHIDKVKHHKPKYVDFKQAGREIKGNLTCMRNQPDQGSPLLNDCFFKIVEILQLLSETELDKLAEHYFHQLRQSIVENRADTEAMLDGFGVLWTDHAQKLLTDYIFLNSKPDHVLIQRLLVHVVGSDSVPSENILKAMEDIAFNSWKFKKLLKLEDTYYRNLLALGSVANKLSKAGFEDRALWLMDKVHNMIGMHDPWKYRQKRDAMSEEEQITYDRHRAVLLEVLGNARMDQSFHYIVSHINDTNSPWIKRAGCHALRKYHHHQAANVLLSAAVNDKDENVRYEAMLLYQAHPKSKIIAPPDIRVKGNGNTTMIVDPYSAGVYDVSTHHRRKRGFWDGIEFFLEAPSVDWRKLLGSKLIGASFGVIMANLLDIKIAPLSGHIRLVVHDEAYARVHLGIVGKNLDFFVARICFKGHTSYNFNMLQEGEMKKIGNLAKQFSNSVKKIVKAVEDGVKLFRDVISGRLSIKDLISKLVDALQELPNKVWSLREKAMKAMIMFGQIDETELPPFLRPLRNLIYKVTKLFNDIKTSIMNFYNTLVETVTVVIPQQGKKIFESIKDIINAFSVIKKDPKTAIAGIGKGVVSVFMALSELLKAKNEVQEACFFLKDNRPYWWDMETQIEIVMGMAANASEALAAGAPNWVVSTYAKGEDPLEKFTGGKLTTSDMKQELINNLTAMKDELLEPFSDLQNLAGDFIREYGAVFGLVKNIKEAYSVLKEGYETARAIIDRIFGPKAHKDFPRTTRLKGGGCDGKGFYKASLKSKKHDEYVTDGVDLIVEEDEYVVAPFPGIVYRTGSNTEVRINATGGSLKDITIILYNVIPNNTILEVTDSNYIEKRVAGGQIVGKVTSSPCAGNNHIHLSMIKPEGAVDPTRFLEPRFPTVPTWTQICDDYRLVYKFETIAEGTIVGIGGQKQNDTSPKVENTDYDIPADLDPSEDPGTEMETIKAKPDGMFKKIESKPAVADELDTEDQCPSTTSVPSESTTTTTTTTTTTAAPGTTKKPGLFKTLLKKADSFLSKYSLRKLRMGTIIELLDKLDMDDSKQKMANVLKTVKKIIDNKPCLNPNQMTEDQLRQELQERGLSSTGSRDVLKKRMLENDNQCPLMSFTMPKNIYCTFDSMCMGAECCINAKIFKFLKVIKIYARFDPCDLEFTIGLEEWNYKLTFEDISFDAFGVINSTTKRSDILKAMRSTLTSYRTKKKLTEIKKRENSC